MSTLFILRNKVMKLSYPKSKKRQKRYDKLEVQEKWIILKRTLIDQH